MKVDVKKLYELVKKGEAKGITFIDKDEMDFRFEVRKSTQNGYIRFGYRLFLGNTTFKNTNFLQIEEIDEAKKGFLKLRDVLASLEVLINE